MVKFDKILGSKLKFKKVFIEITNVCGLNCTFCPPSSRKNGQMSLELFELINSQLKYYTNELAYHIIGDPLVVSNLDEYLKISAKFGLKINITTSGFFLKFSKFQTLTQPNIKQINFSLNSFNANETNLGVDDYLVNIFDFILYKQKHYPELFVNLRLWNLDFEQSTLEFNKKILKKFEDFFGIILDLNEIYSKKPKSLRVAKKVFLNFDEYFEWPSLSSSEKFDGYCGGLDSHFGILASGDVVPCCLDKDNIINLGNLNIQNLDDILNSAKVKNIQQNFKNSICSEELCRKCSYKARFLKN